MLVYTTKLPLASHVTRSDCVDLIIKWLTTNTRYNIRDIDYDISSTEEYSYVERNYSFHVTHYFDNREEITTTRFENIEKACVWQNDCTYVSQDDQKFIIIQLNCHRKDYGKKLPSPNKPTLIRVFVESGLCAVDGFLPIQGEPILADSSNIKNIAAIMKGSYYKNILPVLYVSNDGWGYRIDPKYLSHKLSGLAHVVFEESREFSLLLKKVADDHNAHNGYIGLYYPNFTYHELFDCNDYQDTNSASDDIIETIRLSLINQSDASLYSWTNTVAMRSRKLLQEWRTENQEEQDKLDQYMKSFDSENIQLKESNAQMRAQIDSLKTALQSKRKNTLLSIETEQDLYPNEINDFLINVLGQIKNRFDESSRPYHILTSLLEANAYHGECDRILEEVKRIFGDGGRLNPEKKASLAKLGFHIEDNDPTHIKLVFHDARYIFIVSKTPSDYREGKNTVSEISRIISISRTFLS